MKYYGLFQKSEKTGKKKKKFEFFNHVYVVDTPSYHEALYRLAPIQDWLGAGWELEKIQETEFRLHDSEECPTLGDEFQNLYYVAQHDCEQMIIEGTRLLGLKSDGRTNGYGSYIRVRDTGETCFACPNGQFFDHAETSRLVEKVAAGYLPPHRPTDAFPWKPVLFPYIKQDGEPRINFTHFILSNISLAFPIQFWGHESYDKQIAWIMEREGIN